MRRKKGTASPDVVSLARSIPPRLQKMLRGISATPRDRQGKRAMSAVVAPSGNKYCWTTDSNPATIAHTRSAAFHPRYRISRIDDRRLPIRPTWLKVAGLPTRSSYPLSGRARPAAIARSPVRAL